MKKIYFLLILAILLIIPTSVKAAPVNSKFKDDTLYECIINSLNQEKINGKEDRNISYVVTDDELSQLKVLNCSGYNKEAKVKDTTGIDSMINLTNLQLQYNEVSNIDVSKLTNLERYYAFENKLTNIDVTKNTKLKVLSVDTNELTSIDISNNPLLEYLSVQKNKLTSINVNNNVNLKELYLEDNQLTDLDVSNNVNLEVLKISNNKLKKEVDASKNTKLTTYVHENSLEEIKEPNIENPQTGDLPIVMISILGIMAIMYIYYIFYKNKKTQVQ